MKLRIIIGIVVVLCGVGLIGVSMYITKQVEEGKQTIAGAQKKVDTGGKLFSMSPYTKQAGGAVTGSIQKKIDEGQSEVDKYEKIASDTKIGGYILLAVGALLIFLPRRKKS